MGENNATWNRIAILATSAIYNKELFGNLGIVSAMYQCRKLSLQTTEQKSSVTQVAARSVALRLAAWGRGKSGTCRSRVRVPARVRFGKRSAAPLVINAFDFFGRQTPPVTIFVNKLSQGGNYCGRKTVASLSATPHLRLSDSDQRSANLC
ncbi:unnamed protein product [Cyprideis torosa]|uniref:Uncharacterized protein n=1 Tax=Cyprideis torosa TaxID=163714 RepID=A0A7R8W9X6_9CRUS|nr:unnamed protein product [Cyprideis torosa]CAG0890311.1 unnamed protein product [Cyprideis torosa]